MSDFSLKVEDLEGYIEKLYAKYGDNLLLTTVSSTEETAAASEVYYNLKRLLRRALRERILEELL